MEGHLDLYTVYMHNLAHRHLVLYEPLTCELSLRFIRNHLQHLCFDWTHFLTLLSFLPLRINSAICPFYTRDCTVIAKIALAIRWERSKTSFNKSFFNPSSTAPTEDRWSELLWLHFSEMSLFYHHCARSFCWKCMFLYFSTLSGRREC